MTTHTIVYTHTDEAPALATKSWLPIVKKYLEQANVDIQLEDISLAGRILANFPDQLKDDQKTKDTLSKLGELAKTPHANIIKLPNISASVPQLKEAIKELQSQGFTIPDYVENPKDEDEKQIKLRYSKVLGSAVNPVLREGNSDRRVAGPVKEYAQKNPHSMGEWSKNSKTHVASMSDGDFYGSEKSSTMTKNESLKIKWISSDGTTKILKEDVAVKNGDIVDAAVMSRKKLKEFFAQQIQEAKKEDLLFSLHMKATMMKVSDPVIFGQCVEVYYEDLYQKHGDLLDKMGMNSKNGIGDLYGKLKNLDQNEQATLLDAVDKIYKQRPRLAMVDSDKGITNLHVPSDVIIDASMPACIRSSGKMWGLDGKLHDTKALIPDRSYAGIYQAVIEDCTKLGAFDVTTMGNVSNIGLMAKKAQEYGSHDKTFIIEGAGKVIVSDHAGDTLFEHSVEEGDIWRMCQVKDIAVQDWIKLSLKRAKITTNPVIFWLDENRAHDRELIKKLGTALPKLDTQGVEHSILNPIQATIKTLERVRQSKNTISSTGNVLRDYLTDLFPILELGTSAKMLSIVPLIAGGGLYETGAGGSAPKHVDQFLKEGHLRWDSLGEFLALAVSLEDIGHKSDNTGALALAEGLNKATAKFLDEKKSPSRKVGELDTRGSHFYLSLYWAQEMAEQNTDTSLKPFFKKLSTDLAQNEPKVIEELKNAQGSKVDMSGYYHPNPEQASSAMRPSKTWNSILSM